MLGTNSSLLSAEDRVEHQKLNKTVPSDVAWFSFSCSTRYTDYSYQTTPPPCLRQNLRFWSNNTINTPLLDKGWFSRIFPKKVGNTTIQREIGTSKIHNAVNTPLCFMGSESARRGGGGVFLVWIIRYLKKSGSAYVRNRAVTIGRFARSQRALRKRQKFASSGYLLSTKEKFQVYQSDLRYLFKPFTVSVCGF